MRPKLGMAAVLALIFGPMMLGALLLVLAMNFYAGGTNTRELMAERINLTLDALTFRIEDFLAPVERHLLAIRGRIESGGIAFDDDVALRLYLGGVLTATPQVTGIGLGEADGEVRRFIRGGRSPERVNMAGSPQFKDVMARLEEADTVVWGEPFWTEALGSTVINAMLPLRPPGAGERGVLLAAVRIESFVAHMNSMAQELGQPIFVLHGRDNVVGHSGFDPDAAGLSRTRPLAPVGAVEDPVLASIWDADRRPLNLVEDLIDGEDHRVDLERGPFVFIYREIEGFADLPWLVGTYIPFDEASAEIRWLVMLGVISLVLALLAVAATLLVGRRLARPVARLADQARRIQTMQIQDLEPLPPSRIREIDRAAAAFNAMARALVWFEAYLPKRLVRQLVDHGSPDAVASREREVTIMFTDIVGFSERSSRMSAAETAQFLNRHFTTLERCIDATGGTIDKYIGDSVMAFWGAPLDQPDHAAAACRAAVAMREALAADPQAPRLRIGIHTGPVVVGNIGAAGRLNYTVVGGPVNVAQRLEQLGKELDDGGRGVVLLSAATAEAAGPEFAALPLGHFTLRGQEAAVAVHRL